MREPLVREPILYVHFRKNTKDGWGAWGAHYLHELRRYLIEIGAYLVETGNTCLANSSKNAVAAFTPSPPHFLLEYLCLSAFQDEGVEEQPPHAETLCVRAFREKMREVGEFIVYS